MRPKAARAAGFSPLPKSSISCQDAVDSGIHGSGDGKSLMHLAARLTMSEFRARSLGRGHVLPSPGNRGIVELLTRTASAASDLLAGILWVYKFPFGPVMHTEKTGHFAPHGVTPHR